MTKFKFEVCVLTVQMIILILILYYVGPEQRICKPYEAMSRLCSSFICLSVDLFHLFVFLSLLYALKIFYDITKRNSKMDKNCVRWTHKPITEK